MSRTPEYSRFRTRHEWLHIRHERREQDLYGEIYITNAEATGLINGDKEVTDYIDTQVKAIREQRHPSFTESPGEA